MKTFTVSATLVFLSSFVQALPTLSQAEDRQFTVTVTFEGADPDASFVQYIPTGGSVPICMFPSNPGRALSPSEHF